MSMKYELISQNFDVVLARERAQSSLHRPTLNSLRGRSISSEDHQRFYFCICQEPEVLFLEALFWYSKLPSRSYSEPFSVIYKPRDAYDLVSV
jgi:hypothetical protein